MWLICYNSQSNARMKWMIWWLPEKLLSQLIKLHNLHCYGSSLKYLWYSYYSTITLYLITRHVWIENIECSVVLSHSTCLNSTHDKMVSARNGLKIILTANLFIFISIHSSTDNFENIHFLIALSKIFIKPKWYEHN